MNDTNRYVQVVRGLRHAKRHVFQNYTNDVFREHTRDEHHIYKIQKEDQKPYFDYIVVAMSDSLNDQITHAKVCCSNLYEKQKTKGKGDDPKLLNLYNMVISSTIPIARTCL